MNGRDGGVRYLLWIFVYSDLLQQKRWLKRNFEKWGIQQICCSHAFLFCRAFNVCWFMWSPPLTFSVQRILSMHMAISSDQRALVSIWRALSSVQMALSSIGVATVKVLVRNGSTHHLSSAIVLQHSMGPAARAKIGKSPGLRPLFPKAIHNGIFLLTVPFL